MTASTKSPAPAAPAVARPQISLLLGAVFLVYLGQMTLNPVIAPLSREVGLAEWQVGVTISTAAVMVVATSQFWGRRSQSWGRKPVLVAAFVLATVAMALFALLARLGMAGVVTGGVLFAFFVLLRGVGFGAAIAAVPPTAQAYVADVTPDGAERVKGMAGIGAVQGIAMVAGSVVGGGLSAFGLLAPLVAVPVLLGLALVLLAVRLRRERRHELIERPARVRPTDRRVWPFLAAGFGMFTALGFIQVITGFVVQDRLGLDAAATGLVTGGALLVAGLGMVAAQAVIVPRSRWTPPTLLRVGGVAALAGFVLLVPSAGAVPLFGAILLIGLGLGIAMPGYTAGPTHLVERHEQGGLAGLTTATTGLTFVVAPTAGTALYGIWPALPVVVGAAIMAVVSLFVLLHPRFRRVRPETVALAEQPDGAGECTGSFFGPVRGSLVGIVTLSVVGAASSVVPFIAIVELARTLLPALSGGEVDAGRVWGIVLVAVVALFVSFSTAFLSGLVSHFADAELQLSLRRRIVRHLQRLPLGWFDRRTSGTVRKLVENDVVALHQLVAHAIHDVITAITVPVISLVYLYAVQWQLALAALVPLVLTVVLYPVLMRGGAEKYRRYDEASAALSGATVEFVHGIAVVKRFGQLGRSHRSYRDATKKYVEFVGEWTRETAVLFTVIEFVTSPVVVLVWLLAVGSWLVGTGTAAPVDVLPGLLLGLGLTGPLMKLGFSGQFLRDAVKAQESLSRFFALPPVTRPAAPRTPRGSDIGFDDVAFSYDGEHQVLGDIAAACAPGTVTALVGASGSGKSTLAKLVPRFYDVDQGRVAIGAEDVREIAQDDLYREVGFVFQDVQLLRASLRDNIRLARPGATDEEVEAVARAAQVHDRILRFERGYDAVVGQDANLSGGEAQRVTIARALLADAPVLVLDEATAFADPDSESAIQAALSTLAADRTVLVIAHRLHTITGADQILVLDDGRVVERGTHAELVAAGGRFARMWADYQANHARSLPEGAQG